MNLEFSALDDSRVEEAYLVLKQVGDWLQLRGFRQRISRTSFAEYAHWQSEHANFVVTQAGVIVGLVTLRHEHLDDWPDYSNLGAVLMLRALATHPEHQGRGVAAFAIRESINECSHGKPVFLDCVSDTLPEYYAKSGFKTVGRQIRTYADCESYDITLMRLEPNGGD